MRNWSYKDVETAYRTARNQGMPCAVAHTNVLEAAVARGLNLKRVDNILKSLVLDDRESAALFGPPSRDDMVDIYKRLGVHDE